MKKKGELQGSYGGNTPSLLNNSPFFDNSILHVAKNSQEKNSDHELDHTAKNASKTVLGAESVETDSDHYRQGQVKLYDEDNEAYALELTGATKLSKNSADFRSVREHLVKKRMLHDRGTATENDGGFYSDAFADGTAVLDRLEFMIKEKRRGTLGFGVANEIMQKNRKRHW